jgi:hypothetical protein
MSFTRFPPFRLMRIGKRGNGYLRMLLIHGAPGARQERNLARPLAKGLLARACRDCGSGQQAGAHRLGGYWTRHRTHSIATAVAKSSMPASARGCCRRHRPTHRLIAGLGRRTATARRRKSDGADAQASVRSILNPICYKTEITSEFVLGLNQFGRTIAGKGCPTRLGRSEGGAGNDQSRPKGGMGKSTRSCAAHRMAPGVLSDLSEVVQTLARSLFDPYRPELDYMRGPGPRWHAKHDRAPHRISCDAGPCAPAREALMPLPEWNSSRPTGE